MFLRFVILFGCLLGCSCFSRSQIGQASGGDQELSADREVVYKRVGVTDLKLHVFWPAGWRSGDGRPAIVFFHGGAWSGGTPTQFYPHCRYLASRGMVAMSAEYRVKVRDGTTPKESVMDGKSAVRWIREHANDLGVDPKRVAAGGGSAGGQVAAAAGNLSGFDEAGERLGVSSRPDALVLFNPVVDNGPEGFGYERVSDYWQEFSPLHNLSEKSPPTILFLGTRDKLIPVATGKEYKRRMESFGRRCDLHLYVGRKHGFFNVKNRRNYGQTVEQMDAFLVSLGFLKPQEE
ncbi:alpha/beta hydrolase [Haloferula sp.]|uniref:alpha/beta hydrolase n=1 Tax=Haloferula sp. TaxID=2497595 RepID=UPI003C755F99